MAEHHYQRFLRTQWWRRTPDEQPSETAADDGSAIVPEIPGESPKAMQGAVAESASQILQGLIQGPSERIELTRSQLYEAVWSKSVQQLSKEYGLSDVGLAKRCKHLKIPRPPRGYWAKLANGKKVKKPPLLADKRYPPDKIAFRAWKPAPEKVKAPVEYKPQNSIQISSSS